MDRNRWRVSGNAEPVAAPDEYYGGEGNADDDHNSSSRAIHRQPLRVCGAVERTILPVCALRWSVADRARTLGTDDGHRACPARARAAMSIESAPTIPIPRTGITSPFDTGLAGVFCRPIVPHPIVDAAEATADAA